jgi:hypothetical protein
MKANLIKLLVSTLVMLLVLTVGWNVQRLAKVSFENFLVSKMFEIPEGAITPISLTSNRKIIDHKGQKVETFVVQGNPEAKKEMILYPGLKGVYYYVESIVSNPKLLNEFSRIVTFNYQSQGKSEGVPNQENIISLGKRIYEVYSGDNTVLVCLSNGAIPCTNIATKQSTKTKLIHPFLSASCLIENIYTNYYDYDKLLSTWLQTKKSDQDIARIKFFKNNKDLLRSIYPQSKQAQFLNVNNQINQNLEVYIANQDDYFSKEQNLQYFPNATYTGALSHTEMDEKVLFNILTK